MRYAKGVMWLDDTRIPFVDGMENTNNWTSTRNKKPNKTGWSFRGDNGGPEMNQQGRFTPNLLVCDDMLNDGSESKSGGRVISDKEDTNIKNEVYGKGWVRTPSDVIDKGTNSRYYNLDLWFDKMLERL